MFDIKTLVKPMIPMIKGQVTDERAKQIFDNIMAQYPTPEVGKNILVIAPRPDGMIYGSVATIDDEGHILKVHQQEKLTQVITRILENI